MRKMAIKTEYSGNEFTLIDKNGVCVRGFIDIGIMEKIEDPRELLDELNSFIRRFSHISPEEKRETIKRELGEDLANYLFLSTLVDYGNIGTSETLSLYLRDLYRKYPFLFRPKDEFWVRLDKMDQRRAQKILSSILMPLSGLFRTDFEGVVVPNWRNMNAFLREKCDGDASNFFMYLTKGNLAGKDDPNALEIFRQGLQVQRDRTKLKERFGMNFSIGPKTGSLLLSVMSGNLRGYNILKGVESAHVQQLKAPIDSAVIRVMLNTGIVKVTYVTPQREFGKFARSDITDVCQTAMEIFASRMGVMSVELDQYIWTIGTMPCKHRGRYCFICPITEMCDSWIFGSTKESSGNEYTTRCFSFARPQTAKNALFLRGCENCQQRKTCQKREDMPTLHPPITEGYEAQRFSEGEEKLSLAEVRALVS